MHCPRNRNSEQMVRHDLRILASAHGSHPRRHRCGRPTGLHATSMASAWPSLCLSWGWSLPSQVGAPAAHVDHRLIAPLRTAEAVEGVDRARREETLRWRAVEVVLAEHVLVGALVRRAFVVLDLWTLRVMEPLGPRCAVGKSAGRHRGYPPHTLMSTLTITLPTVLPTTALMTTAASKNHSLITVLPPWSPGPRALAGAGRGLAALEARARRPAARRGASTRLLRRWCQWRRNPRTPWRRAGGPRAAALACGRGRSRSGRAAGRRRSRPRRSGRRWPSRCQRPRPTTRRP